MDYYCVVQYCIQYYVLSNNNNIRFFNFSFTFSMSFKVAGDTSECRLSSGDRGGARPIPNAPFPVPALPEFRPIFTSECRRCSVSAIGTSNKLSVEFCVSTGCSIDELCCLRRQILQHQVFCRGKKINKKNKYYVIQLNIKEY